MSKKWEISRVSTPEHIFDKINNEMAQPVGIVLFGADCELKDDVSKMCVEHLNIGYVCTDKISIKDAEQAYNQGKNVLSVIRGDFAIYQEERQQVVTKLRKVGASSIVGIYAKCSEIYIKCPKDVITGKRPLSDIVGKVANQLARMDQEPPTADGLDYLLTVSEEKEG